MEEPAVGVVDEEAQQVRDVTALLPPGTGVLQLIEGWAHWGPTLAERAPALPATAVDQVRLLAPIPVPRRDLFAVGKNYREHVAEFGRSGYDQPDRSEALPEHPVVFTKATTSVTGPFDDILPHHGVTAELDYEAELGVIIGRGGRGITPRGRVFARVGLHDHRRLHRAGPATSATSSGPSASRWTPTARWAPTRSRPTRSTT